MNVNSSVQSSIVLYFYSLNRCVLYCSWQPYLCGLHTIFIFQCTNICEFIKRNNFQLPVIDLGQSLGQNRYIVGTTAQTLYFSQIAGLTPEDALEDALAISVIEHLASIDIDSLLFDRNSRQERTREHIQATLDNHLEYSWAVALGWFASLSVKKGVIFCW